MSDTCVCCGEIIPEGRMVCLNCEANCGIIIGVDLAGQTDQIKK